MSIDLGMCISILLDADGDVIPLAHDNIVSAESFVDIARFDAVSFNETLVDKLLGWIGKHKLRAMNRRVDCDCSAFFDCVTHLVRGCDSAFALCFTGLSPHQVIVNENLRRITPTAKRVRRQGPRKTETENI